VTARSRRTYTALAVVLDGYARRYDGTACAPSVGRLARRVGVTPRTIRRHLLLMQESGHIKRVPRWRTCVRMTAEPTSRHPRDWQLTSLNVLLWRTSASFVTRYCHMYLSRHMEEVQFTDQRPERAPPPVAGTGEAPKARR
jgi:hypothetical protein